MKSALALAVVGTLIASAPHAFAQMPQTDVAFVEQMKGADADKIDALALYYDLHVSDLVVQLYHEQSTGAFLGARRAERNGDAAEQKRLTDMYESGRIKRDAERETNREIRAKLSKLSGMEFPTELIMAPEAPEMLSKTPADTPANLAKARKAAWANVEGAKAAWKSARLQLLSDQDDYNAGKKGVRIGDSMRSVTRAEINIARAAGDYRLIEARIAIATKKPLAKVLGAL